MSFFSGIFYIFVDIQTKVALQLCMSCNSYVRMSLPSINQDAMEEVSPEENLQCPLGNGRDYSSHNFSTDVKGVVLKWMLQEGLGLIQMTRRLHTISNNTFCKRRLKEGKGMKQCESRKGRPKILNNNAALAEIEVCTMVQKIYVNEEFFLTNQYPKALLNLKSVWLVNLFFTVQAPWISITQLYLVALYFLRSQHKPEIERKRILVTLHLGCYTLHV